MKQKGFTLPELLIASALAMVVSGAAITLYINNYQISTKQENISNLTMQNSIASDFIAQKIRLAGYRPQNKLMELGNMSFDSAAKNGDVPAWTTGQVMNAVDGGATAGKSDTLYLRYLSDGVNTPKCDGTLPASGTSTVTSLSLSGTNLVCDGVTIASNIEDLEFQYGIEKDGLTKWTTAPAEFETVKYVRYCLISRNPSGKKIAGYTQTYQTCPSTIGSSSATVTGNDGFMRAKVEYVIQLRNNEEL